MNYNHYTTCVNAKAHVQTSQYIQATIQGLLAFGAAGLIAGAASMPWCLLLAAELGAVVWLLAYCQWWLVDRLICLEGDRSAAGMLVKIETPDGKSFPDSLDTDFSINLLLFPNQPGADQATVEGTMPYGQLVEEHVYTKNVGLPWTGLTAKDKVTQAESAILHAEFEGAGIQDTQTGAMIALVFTVGALFACLVTPFPYGAIIAAILAFLALLAMLIGLLVGLNDKGSPADVNPALGELNTNNTTEPKMKGSGAAILFIMGLWVYDSGHNNAAPPEPRGWNEIHPIKYCQKIGTWDGDWPTDTGDKIKQQEVLVAEANKPQTRAIQNQPENHWEVHPVIDGCQPANAPPLIN